MADKKKKLTVSKRIRDADVDAFEEYEGGAGEDANVDSEDDDSLASIFGMDEDEANDDNDNL